MAYWILNTDAVTYNKNHEDVTINIPLGPYGTLRRLVTEPSTVTLTNSIQLSLTPIKIAEPNKKKDVDQGLRSS